MSSSNGRSIKRLLVVLLVSSVFLLSAFAGLVKTNAATQQKIVFYSDRTGNNDIYIMNLDGSGQVNLTNDPGDDILPSWSPDGSKIAFSSNRTGSYQIYLMSTDGSNVANLSNSSTQDVGALWSPDSSKLTYTTQSGTGYVINRDGTGKTFIGGFVASVSWKPDSSKFVLAKPFSGAYHIYSYNADGSGEQKLTTEIINHLFVTWSPDGSKIAYFKGGSAPDQYELWVMSPDGTGKTKLTDVSSGSYSTLNRGLPQWSPDSSKILYSYITSNDTYELYMISSSGGSPTPLTSNNDHNEGLWINNSEVLLSSNTSGNNELYSLDTNTLQTTNLTSNSGQDNIFVTALGFISDGNNPNNPNNPPGTVTVTPNAPKAGALVGAIFITVALLSIVLLTGIEMSKEHKRSKKSVK